MAYYWITAAQRYIQGLGFDSITRRPVNMESQDVRINQWGLDNSFSTSKKDELRLGKGGVDDAEDAEVILHEYGHAIMDAQQTPFGYGQSPPSLRRSSCTAAARRTRSRRRSRRAESCR
jgi:hypothetical protein